MSSSSSSSSSASHHEILSFTEQKLLNAVRDSLLCLVCHKLVVDPVDLGCDHIFCYVCLRERIFKKNECPECKAFAQPKDITKSLFVGGVVNAYSKIETIALAMADKEGQIHKPSDEDMDMQASPSNMQYNNNNSSSSSSKHRQSEVVVEVPDTYADDSYPLDGPAVDTQATRLSNCSNSSNNSRNLRRNKGMIMEVPDTYADENFDLNRGDEMEIEVHNESQQPRNPPKTADDGENASRNSHDSIATCTEVDETLIDSEEEKGREMDEVNLPVEAENIRIEADVIVHNEGVYPSANGDGHEERHSSSEQPSETKDEVGDNDGENKHNNDDGDEEEEEDWVESYCSQRSPNLLSQGPPIMDITSSRKRRMYEEHDAHVDEDEDDAVIVNDHAMDEAPVAVAMDVPLLKVNRTGDNNDSQFPDAFDGDGDGNSTDSDSVDYPNTCADMIDQIMQVAADIEKTIDEFKTLQ